MTGILTNPKQREVIALLKASEYGELKGFINPSDNMVVLWDGAESGTHAVVARKIGMPNATHYFYIYADYDDETDSSFKMDYHVGKALERAKELGWDFKVKRPAL